LIFNSLGKVTVVVLKAIAVYPKVGFKAGVIVVYSVTRGYLDVVAELQSRFPNPDKIVLEKDKKDFAKLFGEYLRVENVLEYIIALVVAKNKVRLKKCLKMF
jgi:hypothetical protein